MPAKHKLFLYSMSLSAEQAAALTQLVGKKPNLIRFALIENAADVEPGSENWLDGFRDMLRINGYQVEQVDLRNWLNDRDGLYEKLAAKDVIWLGGGNTYYLRWILKESGADEMITALIKKGKVYSGWSAGAMVAGPTLQCLEAMEPRKEAPQIILEGLNLVSFVVIPHTDNKEFAGAAVITNQALRKAGYTTMPLADNQVLIINGNEQKLM